MAAMTEVARLKSEGRDVLALNIGEPDFAPPKEAMDAAVEALRSGRTRYVPTHGIPELREAIRKKLKEENGLDYQDSEICVGTGAKQLIFAAFGATLNAGDEVIIPAPYWVSYPDITKFFEAEPVIVPCDSSQGFKLTADALAACIGPKTRWVVLNSPGNPSGAVYSESELIELGRVLEAHPHVLVLSDEIYEHFTFGGAKFVATASACPALKDRILTLNGVSKAFAMTGLRLGYGAGPQWLISACAKLISQDTSCANSVSQEAAAAALRANPAYLQANRDAYEVRGQMLAEAINAIPGLSCHAPSGAFYLFVSMSELIGKQAPNGDLIDSGTALVRFLISSAGVVALPGEAFGASNYLRLSFAADETTIQRATDKISEALRQLT
jgi:aspartate aminotransferase